MAGGQRVRRGVGPSRARHLRDGVRGAGAAGGQRAAARAARRLPGAPRVHAAAAGLRRASHHQGRVRIRAFVLYLRLDR